MSEEEYLDGYFNYLSEIILDAIVSADGYDCRDFNAMKLALYNNLRLMLKSREQFENVIKTLQKEDEKTRSRK